jgi:hypothetical protein
MTCHITSAIEGRNAKDKHGGTQCITGILMTERSDRKTKQECKDNQPHEAAQGKGVWVHVLLLKKKKQHVRRQLLG